VRIMVDANILVSAILLDSKRMEELFEAIFERHTLVVASYTIEELFEVAERKFPDRENIIDNALERLPYEMVYTPKEMEKNIFDVRDPDDYPVLYTAIKENVDIFITGDRDLLDVNIQNPEIVSPAQFLEHCMT
jgi:putative PIN family toxin of toxin-antitoxin system